MRAYELSKSGSVELPRLHAVDRLDFEPGAGEVAIDIAACAVCRTDLQITEGDLTARRLPIVPGHQVVGRVRAVGADVERWLTDSIGPPLDFPGDGVGVFLVPPSGSAAGQATAAESGDSDSGQRQ